MQIDNRKDILILGNGLTDRLSDTTINAEAKYSISFSEPKKKKIPQGKRQFFLLVNGVKIYQFKANDSEISSCQLHLGNISKDCTNIKETGLYIERGFNVNKDMLQPNLEGMSLIKPRMIYNLLVSNNLSPQSITITMELRD